jgi:two-component system sensor histidine kinase HydH
MRKKFELLFKPFYTTKNNGTGLGLPISKNLAQKMNGDLSAKLNKPNPGITFTLKLPVNYENSHH